MIQGMSAGPAMTISENSFMMITSGLEELAKSLFNTGKASPQPLLTISDLILPIGLILIVVAVILILINIPMRKKISARAEEFEKNRNLLEDEIDKRKEIERELIEERNRSLFYLDLMIHDISNIHQGLISHVQLHHMIKDDKKKSDSNVKQMGELLTRSQELVKNISKFTEAVGPERTHEAINIKPVIIDSLRTALISTPEMDVETDVDLPDRKMMVVCEPLIEDLFHNLFHNAVRSHDGPRAIVEVRGVLDRDDKYYRILISDHGRGIPDRMKRTIFNRVEVSSGGKNRGMGMTLVKVLVERYGGTIEIDDRIKGDHKRGTTFILRLPVAEKQRNGKNLYS